MKLASLYTVLLLLPCQVFAGPGGKVAKAVFETFWGKVLLTILIVVLLPLILWVTLKERAAKKRTMKALNIVGASLPDFSWISLRKRIRDSFLRVHAAWEDTDVSQAAEWMTSWYWQNQQMVFLDRWKREGLENICEISKVNHIRPILFSYRADNGQAGEGSEIAVLIEASMKDYLVRKSDGEVVEGSKRKKDVERVWSFSYQNGQWLVSDIDEGNNSLEYVEIMKGLPAIEEVFDPSLVEPCSHQSGRS